ncbi:MAG: hypothetical protein KGL39_10020 [Patescibacteria group bacterium]|nr:hypothetical protein [Patescibacteria group bacterium]
MTIGTTTTLLVNRDDIISASLRLLEVIGVGETPEIEDFTNSAQALNIMVKAWQIDGYKLWAVKDLSLPLVSGNATYQIGPSATGTGALVTDRPLRLQDSCYIRDSNGHDTSVMIVSRQEYNILGAKSSPATPTQIFYDPQLTNGVLTVFPAPVDSTHTLHLIVQKPLADFNLSTDNPDFPQEWYQALKWGLAAELGLEYGVPERKIARIEQKAAIFKEQLNNWSQEEADVYFVPDSRMTFSGGA